MKLNCYGMYEIKLPQGAIEMIRSCRRQEFWSRILYGIALSLRCDFTDVLSRNARKRNHLSLTIHSWGLLITFRVWNGTFCKSLLKVNRKEKVHNLENYFSYMWIFDCKLAKIMLHNFYNELLNNRSNWYVFWDH